MTVPDPDDRTRADGTGRRDRPRAPLQSLRVAVALAGLYAAAGLGALGVGSWMANARWYALHLFTLGVVTNLVVALTHHFAQTVVHAPARRGVSARLAALNVGVLAAVVSGPGADMVFGLGATVVLIAVVWLYVDLRRMRKQALSTRFAFVVRAYERACGAFLHGSAIGLLLGLGLFGSAWYAGARLAHLHLNVLGWGGYTVLATVVFFGPTMMRARMEPGADDRAARALRHGMTALTVGALLILLSSGLAAPAGTAVRVAAGVTLGGYAAAATVICRDVIRAGRRAKPSLSTWMISSASIWFVAVVWADVVLVVVGRWQLLDALGAALLVAVLGQAILAATAYLAPLLAHGGPGARAAVRERIDVAGRSRTAILNAGALTVVVTAALGRDVGATGAAVLRLGWGAVGAVVVVHLVMLSVGVLQAPRRAAVGRGTRQP